MIDFSYSKNRRPFLSDFERRREIEIFIVSYVTYIIVLESQIKVFRLYQPFARHHVRSKRKSKPRFRSIDASHGCTVSSLAYLESENRITSISSAVSGPSASQERRHPCTLSSSPFVSRDRAHGVITPRRRGGREGWKGERGWGRCGLLRFIDLSPSTFTLPSRTCHTPPSLFPGVALFFSRRATPPANQSEKMPEKKKQDTFCLSNAPSSEARWSCRKKGTKGLWLRSFRDPNVFGNLKGLPGLSSTSKDLPNKSSSARSISLTRNSAA